MNDLKHWKRHLSRKSKRNINHHSFGPFLIAIAKRFCSSPPKKYFFNLDRLRLFRRCCCATLCQILENRLNIYHTQSTVQLVVNKVNNRRAVVVVQLAEVRGSNLFGFTSFVTLKLSTDLLVWLIQPPVKQEVSRKVILPLMKQVSIIVFVGLVRYKMFVAMCRVPSQCHNVISRRIKIRIIFPIIIIIILCLAIIVVRHWTIF